MKGESQHCIINDRLKLNCLQSKMLRIRRRGSSILYHQKQHGRRQNLTALLHQRLSGGQNARKRCQRWHTFIERSSAIKNELGERQTWPGQDQNLLLSRTSPVWCMVYSDYISLQQNLLRLTTGKIVCRKEQDNLITKQSKNIQNKQTFRLLDNRIVRLFLHRTVPIHQE